MVRACRFFNMYRVVEFEDGVMAVPTKWINDKKDVCKWPPYSNTQINKAIRKNEDVGCNWDEISITKIFGKPLGMHVFHCL